MRQCLLIVTALAASLAVPASAQEGPAVAQARAAGLIGERYDGYIGIVAQVSPVLRRQVAGINIRRRSLYSGLAARRGATPEEVGITTACALLDRVGVNEAYQLAAGGWQRRMPDQAAPRPEYCGR